MGRLCGSIPRGLSFRDGIAPEGNPARAVARPGAWQGTNLCLASEGRRLLGRRGLRAYPLVRERGRPRLSRGTGDLPPRRTVRGSYPVSARERGDRALVRGHASEAEGADGARVGGAVPFAGSATAVRP